MTDTYPVSHPNKFPGACTGCGARVPEKLGVIVRFEKSGKWFLYHAACDPTIAATATTKAPTTRKAGDSNVASLYGSMQGARGSSPVGGVGHKELTIQIQTGSAAKQTGMVRVYVEENGDYEVYLADGDGSNGLLLIAGNVPSRTVGDADGNPIKVAPLSSKLDPIVVKNRGKAYVKQAPPSAPTSAPKVAQGAAAQAPPKAQEAPAKKAAKAPKVDVSKLKAGDRVKLTEDSTGKIGVGTEGAIESIKQKSPLGPQITVAWDGKPASVIFPKQGDVIEVTAAVADATVTA